MYGFIMDFLFVCFVFLCPRRALETQGKARKFLSCTPTETIVQRLMDNHQESDTEVNTLHF